MNLNWTRPGWLCSIAGATSATVSNIFFANGHCKLTKISSSIVGWACRCQYSPKGLGGRGGSERGAGRFVLGPGKATAFSCVQIPALGTGTGTGTLTICGTGIVTGTLTI